ncbi:MAG: DUF1415 domain-containing protein [Tatlockia sp.]|nr:DUF1415 domain-containing protein [Tatlockia sp.]
MTDSDNYIVQHTENWIRSFIIQLNICPFAKREVERKTLRMKVSRTSKVAQALEQLIVEMQLLDNEPAVETTLLIFPCLFKDFFDYLDFVDLAELLLFEQSYEGIYQLATFHPGYCFAEVDIDDTSNYTNRSPYPMIHILREESVEKAIAYFGETDKIPEANIKSMHKLGINEIKKILAGCIPEASLSSK